MTIKLTWDIGTAYDLFVSLHTLHNPSKFGLRGAWAAGVRSRLNNESREFLQEATELIYWPIGWVHHLPAPKDAQTALNTLADLPAKQRLPQLTMTDHATNEWTEILHTVYQTEKWEEAQQTRLQELWLEHESKGRKGRKKKDDITTMLNWWANSEEFGERYLAALQDYYEVFFAEDETRIAEAMQTTLENAQALAQQTDSVSDLLESLSYGVQYETEPNVSELVLAPSFWGSPFLLFGPKTEERMYLLFGGRPSDASLVPGDIVPDALFQALKALADPTRLRILRYLTNEPMTPAKLARKLRLRAPTVIHHLHALRLARLVHLVLSEEGRRYQARREAIDQACVMLNTFMDAETIERGDWETEPMP